MPIYTVSAGFLGDGRGRFEREGGGSSEGKERSARERRRRAEQMDPKGRVGRKMGLAWDGRSHGRNRFEALPSFKDSAFCFARELLKCSHGATQATQPGGRAAGV